MNTPNPDTGHVAIVAAFRDQLNTGREVRQQMSNSRSFRRRLGTDPQQPKGQRWNKGLAMTSDPSGSTTRRWLNAAEDKGILERAGTQRTGKPGRPAQLRALTEEGREQARHLPPKAVMQERLRRQENARKQGSRPKGRRVTQADMTLAAGMMISATGKLIAADGDVSALLPEEVDALIKYQCATWKGGTLVLKPAWLEDYNRTPGETGDETA
jgi:DNA-binding PadR family transcriptional regulator